MDAKSGKKPQRPTYPEYPTCSQVNHPAEKCWRGAEANLRPERNRQDSKNREASEDEGNLTKIEKSTTSASSQSNSNKPDSKNKFCHDSKDVTECRYDNMSYPTLLL